MSGEDEAFIEAGEQGSFGYTEVEGSAELGVFGEDGGGVSIVEYFMQANLSNFQIQNYYQHCLFFLKAFCHDSQKPHY